jgi:DNA-binding CsgD family transcriptional regulator
MNMQSENTGMSPIIWDTFTSDPTTGVTILTADGEIVYINKQSTRIFFNESRDTESLIGVSIFDIGFPREWADERVGLMRQIVADGKRRLLRTVWNGKQQFSWMSPIDGDEEDGRDLVLVITRRVPTTHEHEYLMGEETEVTRSGVICLGKLSVLTARELEILALLGQGMSIKEIASLLVRSVKTIENHRESIGRKLKRTRGVELAGIAQSAWLAVEDSKRIRMDKVSRNPCKGS